MSDTPERHAREVEAVRASLLLSSSAAERHNSYPAFKPRGTDSREISKEIVPGAALAAAVLRIYSRPHDDA